MPIMEIMVNNFSMDAYFITFAMDPTEQLVIEQEWQEAGKQFRQLIKHLKGNFNIAGWDNFNMAGIIAGL